MDADTIWSYVDEIKRLRQVVDAMGEHGHKLKERVRYGKLCGKSWKGICSGYPMYHVVCHTYSVNFPREFAGVVEGGMWTGVWWTTCKKSNVVWRGSVEPFKVNIGNTWFSGDNFQNNSIGKHWELKETDSLCLEVDEEMSEVLYWSLKEPVYMMDNAFCCGR